jgi:hypothetical protein
MDYLNIGSNGFAQLGDIDYHAKNRVEMNYLMELIMNKFPVPEKIQGLCRFAVKAFNHDFGTYHEIVIHYNDELIDDDCDEEENGFPFTSEEELNKSVTDGTPVVFAKETLHDIFWNWFYEVEAFNLETEEINEAIKALYLGTLNTAQAEHLKIVQRKKAS